MNEIALERQEDGSYKLSLPEATEVAEMHAGGALSGVLNTEFAGLKIGEIGVGTFGGVMLSEVIEGFLSAQSTMIRGGAKLGIAALTASMGKKWIGKDAANVIAFVLGVFGLSQVIPVDKWASAAASGISKFLPGTIKVTGMPGNSALNQAERVANSYYSSLSRRAG